MTLEEGLNLEKRFFQQTFGTVSILRKFRLYRKLKAMMSFRCRSNSICICARQLHLFKYKNINPRYPKEKKKLIGDLITGDNSDGQVIIVQADFGTMPNVCFRIIH